MFDLKYFFVFILMVNIGLLFLELMKLLFSILYPKPELRATIKDIENNEWVTQYVDIDKYKWEHVIKNTGKYNKT